MFKPNNNRRRDGMYALGAAVCVLAFFSLPFILSHIGSPALPPPVEAAAPETVVETGVLGGKIVFKDASAQSREYIGYYHTVQLSAEQEAVKKEVLAAMPAACCNDSTAYTCCCACNLSKTIWGLSNYVIAKHGAGAKELKPVVDAWLAFVSPNGFAGNTCHRGGCEASMARGGCGGMNEHALSAGRT